MTTPTADPAPAYALPGDSGETRAGRQPKITREVQTDGKAALITEVYDNGTTIQRYVAGGAPQVSQGSVTTDHSTEEQQQHVVEPQQQHEDAAVVADKTAAKLLDQIAEYLTSSTAPASTTTPNNP